MTALKKSVLAYDVGGSHISAAVSRPDCDRLDRIVSASLPTPQTMDAFFGVCFCLGNEVLRETPDIGGIAMAMPGPFDYSEGISWMQHKLPYLYGHSLRGRLAEQFGLRSADVRFANDADAFLLGELYAGAAKGFRRAVGITLGTGIGSAFAVDGVVVTQGHGVPPGGDVWNLPYGDGTVEDAISTRALQQDYKKQSGTWKEVSEIADAASADAHAAVAFAGFGSHLGLALRSILFEFSPDVIVLGGGISRSSHLFFGPAYAHLKDLACPLLASSLMDQAPLLGAAAAWWTDSETLSRVAPVLSNGR